ncbi:MAG: hypothetical protein A3D31_04840 [Candidatus Fluviicola riflensis]|nr:MAG: hypothetical protein CHH17_10180 [Candidatus Fluviicola riflensis]OGS79302.1 MAG: hypothetical protein A3D31_04840 [Candidatus Fluviicola riflensis]OGS86734.1 MAG: hypothetical protein A2724_04300 [Fluviicola sp. RIFCSPHIGHO2_01_FULL_43_53]OGS88792.1 MAG: hypothetical protein A3E30_00360 [Fluviicola sp. RIFCSPHIGHO2_12_FULL_43_24]
MSCTSSSEELEKAEEGVTEANEKLDEANETYLREVEEYKQETRAKIADNEQTIADFLVLSEEEKKENQAAYRKGVEKLRAENEVLKMKLENFGARSKAEWREFKKEFNEEMLELSHRLNEFRIKKRVE